MFRSPSLRKSVTYAVILSVLSTTALTGCSSTTTIRSTPPGAEVTIDGVARGQAPIVFKSKKTVFKTHKVLLRWPDGTTASREFSRDGDVNVGAVVGGIFLLVPFLWVLDYEDSYTFEATPGAQQ